MSHSLLSTSCHPLLSIAACLVLSALPAAAACKVKAIFVQPPDGAPTKAVLVAGKKSLEIELPQRNFSPEVELPAGTTVVGVLPTKLEQPEMPPGAPVFKIPENWTNCILLFFPDSSNKVFPAKVITVNASSADFPLGHTLIFNLSPATVMAKFGGEVASVKPGQSVTVKPPRAGSGEFPISIDCAYPGDKEPTALCRSTWQHESNARQIRFITPMPEQKTPRVWGVLDRPAPSGQSEDR